MYVNIRSSHSSPVIPKIKVLEKLGKIVEIFFWKSNLIFISSFVDLPEF